MREGRGERAISFTLMCFFIFFVHQTSQFRAENMFKVFRSATLWLGN